MKIKKLIIYNTALRDELHNKVATMLSAETPDQGSLAPCFDMVNGYLDQATTIEIRIQFLERIKASEESNNNK
jgi:hypothetical protein